MNIPKSLEFTTSATTGKVMTMELNRVNSNLKFQFEIQKFKLGGNGHTCFDFWKHVHHPLNRGTYFNSSKEIAVR
jgi:hypothetical protein